MSLGKFTGAEHQVACSDDVVSARTRINSVIVVCHVGWSVSLRKSSMKRMNCLPSRNSCLILDCV